MAEERVVVVEDEEAIAEVLAWNLEQAGFRVDLYHRGDEALEALRAAPPDLLLLDLMLPGLDGLEITRQLRRHEETARLPIVMLTARGEELDRIVGLELGADDYIPKPFSPREVVLRVQAVLRRSQQPSEPAGDWIEVGSIRLDPEGFRVEVDGEELTMTATEFRLLEALMRAAPRARSREALLTEVWEYSPDVDSRTVDTHVGRLRKKLGPEADRLETVIGVGYRLKR